MADSESEGIQALVDAVLEVTWPMGGRLTTRGMLVYLDGKEISELPQGHTMRYSCAPGRHTLRVSNKLFNAEDVFDAKAGEKVLYETGMRGAGCFAPMLMLGTPALTVYLERKSA